MTAPGGGALPAVERVSESCGEWRSKVATDRFEKLSEDKKRRILEAAREEFARVPYEEASINQIIKNAGISRGSFYTYFEDKSDLLQYVFSEDEEDGRRFFRKLVIENKGDFWKAITDWTVKVAGYLEQGNIQQRINILVNSGVMKRAVAWSDMGNCKKQDKEKEQMDWLMEKLDLSLLDYRGSRERFEAIVKSAHMIAGLAILNLIVYQNSDTEKILREFNLKMEILRFGGDPRK